MADDMNQLQVNQTQPETLDQRVRDVEKGQAHSDDKLNWALDLLKWGLGIFATVALVFAGGNAWIAKSNYDRDKEQLEQRVALIKQQLAADNEKQIAELRKQAELAALTFTNSFTSLSNNFQNQFLTLQAANSANISNSFVIVTPLLLTSMTNLVATNDFRFALLITNLNIVLSNTKANLEAKVQHVLGETTTNINDTLARVSGGGMMLQANMISHRLELDKAIAEASAAESYIQACRLLYQGHDERNLQRCLQTLCGECLSKLVTKNSKTTLQVLVSRYNLTSQIKSLIGELKTGDEHERYGDSIEKLQYYLDILEGKVIVKK